MVMKKEESVGGCRSLTITNLDPRVDEMLLSQVFSVAGPLLQIRLVPDRLNPGHPLAYIEFQDHSSAETAHTTLAGQKIYDFPITINWNFQQQSRKEDTSTHYHIWVGDIASDVDDNMLIKSFAVFPTMSDARIMWDQQTGKSRGYGFVSFRDKNDAERAISTMQGQFIGSKPIRVNWAHQKNGTMASAAAPAATVAPYGAPISVPTTPGQLNLPKERALDYQTVLGQSSQLHTTVYIGNLSSNASTEMLMPYFQSYGYVMDITLHLDRGFAFVKMDTHENAANAISYLHGHTIGGNRVRCSWGKDRIAEQAASAYPQQTQAAHHHHQHTQHTQQQQQHQYYGYGAYAGYGYGQANPYAGYGYGQYAQGYDYSQYASQYYQQQAAAAAAAQQQQQQQPAAAYQQQPPAQP